MKYKFKNEENKVLFVIIYYFVFRGLNVVLKKNLLIFYSNDKMVEVFKNFLMVVFKCFRNFKDMVVRIKLKNFLFNGGFRICFDIRCLLCKYSFDVDDFFSFIIGCIYKIFVNIFCCMDNCVYFINCKFC